jgi:16S rRNA (adenine1518-N6/adenine1519-N6)-dimethyltransferase
VDLLDFQQRPLVWEIGPGLGAMTVMMKEEAGRLLLFEIDRGFIRFLNSVFHDDPQVRIIPGDVIKTWKDTVPSEGEPDLIFGNLPYRSASGILLDFLLARLNPKKMVFTVQKEVAQRMTAVTGSKSYSSFSVLCSLAWNVRVVTHLSSSVFYPAPEVSSSIIEIVPDYGRTSTSEWKQFTEFNKKLFSSRRKTLRNNLSALIKNQFRQDPGFVKSLQMRVEKSGFLLSKRAEELPPADLLRLFRIVSAALQSGEDS